MPQDSLALPEQPNWIASASVAWSATGVPALEDPVDLAIAPDGTILVLDAGARAVFRMSPHGEPLGHFGRAGAGPGEFGAGLKHIMVSASGHVFVPDPSERRVEIFAPDGRFERTLRMMFGTGPTLGFAVLGSDEAVYRAAATITPDAEGRGVLQPRIHIYLLERDTTIETTALDAGARPRTGLYAGQPGWAQYGNGVVTTDLDAFTVRFFDSRFEPTKTWTADWKPRAITKSDQDRLLPGIFSRTADPGLKTAEAMAMLKERVGFADSYPPVVHVIVADDGAVWLNQPATADDIARGLVTDFTFDETGSPFWRVYGADGRHRMDLQLPTGFYLKQVRNGVLYGLATGATGAPVVEALTAPSPAPPR